MRYDAPQYVATVYRNNGTPESGLSVARPQTRREHRTDSRVCLLSLEHPEKSPLLFLDVYGDIVNTKCLRNSKIIESKIVNIEYGTRTGIKGGLFSGCSWYSLFYQPAGIIPVPVSCRTYRKTL